MDPAEHCNYRPISKLPFLSKVLEKVVAEQLTAFLSNNGLLDKYQSGFRKMHSTETALLKVSNEVQMAADSGRYSVLVLLDLSSAFDTVDHKILLHRLENEFGVAGSVLKWFSSYLSDRTFFVYVNDILSEATPFLNGVPPGICPGSTSVFIVHYPSWKYFETF